MTLAEFKFLLQPGNTLDSVDRDVNISYTGSRIEAIAVRITGENLIQLQQANTIILKAPESGSVLNISLESTQVPIRTVNRERVGNYYLYSIIEQSQQPIMTIPPTPSGILPSEEYFTDVIILPSIEGGVFEGSDYDVLLNNSMNNRLSTYLQISDRAERSGGTTNPINLPSILIDNATLASVQDSNYSDTGWINGRYDGTPTTKLTFGNVDPAVTGKSFQGSSYSLDISDSIISNQAETDRVYETLLHTSNTDYPEYSVRVISYTIGAPVSATQTTLGMSGSLTAGDPRIAPGDLLTIVGSLEILKVVSIIKVPSGIGSRYQLEVIRGWNDTQAVNYFGSINPRVTTPVQIFEVNRSRLTNVNKSKIYIKDNETILFVDDLGQVVSSSLA